MQQLRCFAVIRRRRSEVVVVVAVVVQILVQQFSRSFSWLENGTDAGFPRRR